MRFGKGMKWLPVGGSLALAAVLLSGCGSGSDNAPYGSAVNSLEEHGTKIRDAFGAGKPENAHDSLHEVGNILDKFPKLVDGTKLSPADRDAAKQAADELFDSYTELDLSLHDGKAMKYEEVSEEIDTNLAILKGKIAAAGESGVPIADAKHDDHDHAHDDNDHAHEDHAHDGEEEHDHEHGEGDTHHHEHEGDEHAPGEPEHVENK